MPEAAFAAGSAFRACAGDIRLSKIGVGNGLVGLHRRQVLAEQQVLRHGYANSLEWVALVENENGEISSE